MKHKHFSYSCAAVLVLLLACGCSSPGTEESLPSTTASAATAAAPTPVAPASTITVTSTISVPADDAGPQEVAVAWLTAYRSATWTEPFDAWIDRSVPLVGPELAASYEALRDNGKGGGLEWANFVADRCTAKVLGAGAVIPPEAPRTDTEVAVQVAATVVTTCQSGALIEPELITATLTVTTIDNRWRATSRDY